MTLPVLRGFGCWGLMRGVWHHQDRRRRGPVSSLASWTTRGEDHPTARLLDLVPGRSGTVHENWLAERGEQFRSGIQIATVDPFQGQQERLREAFTADEVHISVEVAYHCAQQVREVFHQATPTQGQRLAARLIERLPACPVPEIARLGQTLRKWKDALDDYFDTGGASNGSTEAINGHYRAGQTHRQRLPQPHQLPTPNPHRRRSRCLHPYSTLKSQYTVRV